MHRLVLGGTPVYMCATAEKMSAPFKVTVRGRAGHASMPGIADNALVKAARYVEALGSYEPPREMIPEARGFLEAVLGEAPPLDEALARAGELHPMLPALVEPLLSLTLSPTMIDASHQRNVIPAQCEITVDCRLLPEQTPADAEPLIRAALGNGAYELEFTEAVGGTRSPMRDAAVGRARAVHGGDRAGGSTRADRVRRASPTATTCARRIGTTAYGYFPIKTMDTELATKLVHSANERTHVDDLELGTRHASLGGDLASRDVTTAATADAFVVFGITGDLARRSTLPALYSLFEQGLLTCPVIGVGRRPVSHDEFARHVREAVEAAEDRVDREVLDEFLRCLTYIGGDAEEGSVHERLREALAGSELPVYYLATPPSMFLEVAEELERADLVGDASRLVVEKPFGTDLGVGARAQPAPDRDLPRGATVPDRPLPREGAGSGHHVPALRQRPLRAALAPRARRVDPDHHGRGLRRRRARTVLRPCRARCATWSRTTSCRSSPSSRWSLPRATSTRSRGGARTSSARCRRSTRSEAVLGQYIGYRRDRRRAPRLATPRRSSALRLEIENWRWAGVPILVRAGKSLPTTATEIVIRLQRVPQLQWGEHTLDSPGHDDIVLRIGRQAGVSIFVRAKTPGKEVSQPVSLDLDFAEELGEPPQPVRAPARRRAARRQTLFPRWNVIEATWRIVQPLLDSPPPVEPYEPGTWGPARRTRSPPTTAAGAIHARQT